MYSFCIVGRTFPVERPVEDAKSGYLVRRGKVSIPKGHLEILVAKKFLDRGKIHAPHNEKGRKGMPVMPSSA